MNNFSTLLTLSLVVAVTTASYAAEPELTEDQLHIAVQQICPVSGQKLGAHGDPIKVTVGEQKEEIFLCCKGCLKQKINPQHWVTIHGNMMQAQRMCPVMKKPLPSNPKWTIVDGHVVFVCCPPCTDKIAAKPDAFLSQLDQLYAQSVAQREGTK